MRNLKKLLAVIMVVAMLASIMVPALAADNETVAKQLQDLGLFKGYSDTELGLGDGLTREQALAFMLRVMGLEDEALAMSKEEVVECMALVVDPETVTPTWAQPYVAYGIKTGLVKGIDASIAPKVKFDGQRVISGQEFVRFIMNGLGYTEDVVSWNEVMGKAVEVGLLSANKAIALVQMSALTRGDVVPVLASALTATTIEGITLAERLIEGGDVDEAKLIEYGYFSPSPTPTEAPVELEVTDVVADNLKEILLVFNKPLDKDTVKADNFRIKKSGTTITNFTVSLKDDNQTVVVRAKDDGNFENQVKYEITIKNVKDSDKVAIKETTIEVTPFDRYLPEVVDIRITGPRSLEVEFSEPIKTPGSISLKTGSTTVGVNSQSIAKSIQDSYSNVVKFELYSDLTDGKTYTITIKDFADFAGYKMVNYVGELEYVADKSEIVATVEKAEQTYVVIKFNKPVKGLKVDFFYHTFSAWKPLGIYSDENMTKAVTSSEAVDKIWVKFYDPTIENEKDRGYPIPEGETKLVIRDKVGDDKIKDNWGNEFLGAELIVVVSADKTPPSVAELKVEAEDKIKVKFDEEVKFSEDNVEILNADGTKISDLKITVEGSGKEYTIVLSKKLSGKSIIVNIKNVEDKALSPNKLTLYSEVLDISDHTDPTVTKVTYKVDGNDKSLFVFFSESVNDTALNKDNYYLIDADGNWSKFENAPEFYDGDKVVRIELKDAEFNKLVKVAVRDVEDLAGNKIVLTIIDTILPYDDVDNKPSVKKAEATATNKVVLTFDQYLTDVEADAFEVNGAAPIGMEVSVNDDGNTVVTLTTDDDYKFSHDATKVVDSDNNVVGTPSVAIVNASKLKNIFGVEAQTTVPTIDDKIRPEIAKNGIETVDSNGDGKIDNLVVKFTEKIKFNYIAATTFTVEGYTVVDAYATTVVDAVYNVIGPATNVADSDIVVIRVKQKDDVDGAAKPKVKVVTEIRDLKDNKYDLEKDAVAAVDKVAPVVVTKLPAANTTISSNTTHKVVFSEALDSANKTAVENAVKAAYEVENQDDATIKTSWSSDGRTLTITITVKAGKTVTLKSVAPVNIKDAAGNESEEVALQ